MGLVHVVRADRVDQLTAPIVEAPGTHAARLRALLDGATVLAHTTDDSGLRRFTRALRARLEAPEAAIRS